MRKLTSRDWTIGLLASAICALPGVAAGQTAEAFYASKPQMKMIISSSAGGGYDFFGRTVARHLPNHLPGNPQILAQNMPGAGGMVATNFLYNIAPKDGTTIGIIDRGIPTAEILYGKDSKSLFDATKFNWIGSLAKEIGVGLISTRSSAKSLEDMRSREVLLATNGLETDSAMYARLLNATVGTKFRAIAGYPGQVEYYMSMIRGETEGLFMSGWSGPNRLTALRDQKEGAIRYFVQMSSKRHPDFGDTPTIFELVKDETNRRLIEILMSRLELGRPILAPPGIAADRVRMLRAAFDKMVADEAMIAEVTKAGNTLEPVSGEQAQEMIARLFALPADVKAKLQSIVRIPK
jgi:tripartite-type tricarboxylate transporter receptor subunit TctC